MMQTIFQMIVYTSISPFLTIFSKPLFPESFNSLPNDKNLHWPKFKAFSDDNLNVAKMMISLYDRVENIVGKGEIADY